MSIRLVILYDVIIKDIFLKPNQNKVTVFMLLDTIFILTMNKFQFILDRI